MEHVLVLGAVTTVLTAVIAILYRITVGDRQNHRLEKLKAELEAAKKAPKP